MSRSELDLCFVVVVVFSKGSDLETALCSPNIPNVRRQTPESRIQNNGKVVWNIKDYLTVKTCLNQSQRAIKHVWSMTNC